MKELTAMCNGQIIPLREVRDPIFSQRLTGDGAAIIPSSAQFVAPCDGTIKLVFKGGHALVIETLDQVDIMIHIGIGTVNLNGAGFKNHVKKGQSVKQGELLVEVDMDLMKQKKMDLTSLVLVMNPKDLNDLEIVTSGHATENQTKILSYLK